MPIIVFDVLLPDDRAEELGATFQRALDILVRRNMLASGDMTHEPHPPVPEENVALLREHHPVELPGAHMHRYLIEATGEDLSYNQLAMSLSRILTPEADLPADPVELEQEEKHEVAALYPWTLDIRR